MSDGAILVLGVLAAAAGGELFVRGAVGLAAWIRIPKGIIGATVAAFATSSPELSVALNAASAGQPQIPLGDALGSNVANIGLVLGCALLLMPMAANRQDVRRDLPFGLLAPALTGLLIVDGRLGRVDGLVLLAVFVTWLTITVLQARRARSATARIVGERRPPHALAQCFAGVVLLVVAGRLIVIAAHGIVEALGLDAFIVGATIVALGTSAPELATTLTASFRGHSEIGLGTVVGSNIFNNLWILGITALVAPIPVARTEVALALGASFAMLVLVIPSRRGQLARRRGAVLTMGYGLYVITLVSVAP